MSLIYDMRGLKCPLPVLKVNRRLRDLPQGGKVVVICDDPSAPGDFREYCARTGHRFVSCRKSNEEIHLTLDIRSRGDSSP